MVYEKKFVAVVKCNGKILREKEENEVTLPFGSEYSILFKNLDSRDAVINVSIDGQDVLYGTALIIRANTTAELFGKIQGSVVKNRFKFIQKTKAVQSHRGDKIDDGIIRIEYAFEKRVAKTITTFNGYYTYDVPVFGSDLLRRTWYTDNSSGSVDARGITYSSNNTVEEKGASNPVNEVVERVGACYHSNVTLDSLDSPVADEGITVAGSRIDQHFTHSHIGETEQSDVIIIRLKGISNSGEKVTVPLTVKTKLECPTCGKVSKSDASFCSQCGTCLE